MSVNAAHTFATRLAAIGARSITAASRVRAAGDLVRADADTYAHQEALNSRALALGASPSAETVGAPRMAAVPPVASQCPLPEAATTPTDGKHIAELVHGGPGETGLDEVARHLRSHAEELQGTAASLGSHALDLAATWISDAGAEAESTVCRLAADHADNGEHAATLAQRLMTQATDFQMLRRDVPAPGEFARVERQLQYAIAASEISSVYAGAVVTLRTELAELHEKATTAYASYTSKTEGNIAGLDAQLDREDTVRLVSNEIKLSPPDPATEDSEDQPGDKPSVPSQAPGQIGPFPVPKAVEDAAKDLDAKPGDTSTTTGDVGGDLGDLLGGADDTAAEGKPEDGQPAKPGGENTGGFPPVLSQIPPPPDKAAIDGQAAKVEAARQTLADAQAQLNNDAAVPDYTQGAGAGPGRGVSDPLSQAVFDARAELTAQTRVLNELNSASAAAGGPTAPVAPLPENADVQANPPEPRQSAIGAFASGTADMYGTLTDAGIAPDVGNMYDVATGWGEATPSERVQAGLDGAGFIPLPGSKWIGDGIGWGLDRLGVFRWMDGDIPTPHADRDVPTPQVHGDVHPHHVDGDTPSPHIPPPELREVVTDSGGKGNWNQELNRPEPNTRYLVDNRFEFVTDGQGRVTHAEMSYDRSHLPGDRNEYQQRIAGGDDRLPNDHGGHTFPAFAGAPGEAINITPMRDTLNAVGERAWYNMEQDWRRIVAEGGDVRAVVDTAFPGDSRRPDMYTVRTYVDGQLYREDDFYN